MGPGDTSKINDRTYLKKKILDLLQWLSKILGMILLENDICNQRKSVSGKIFDMNNTCAMQSTFYGEGEENEYQDVITYSAGSNTHAEVHFFLSGWEGTASMISQG